MTSVVTNDFRKVLLNFMRQDVASANSRYYVGLARSDSDEIFSEENSLYAQRKLRHTLQSVKLLSDASFVIPTVEWTIGEIYEPWSDKDYNQTNFYVVNPDTNEVFICIDTAKNPEGVVQPVGTIPPTAALASNTGSTFITPDGYHWRYMYKISNIAYARYRSKSFIPVKEVTRSIGIQEEDEQLNLQSNAVDGEILRMEFDSGGSFSSTPTITIDGNGDSASFSVVMDGNQIAYIKVDSDGEGRLLHGSGYDYASASLSSGNVRLTPVIGPKGGLNHNPVEALKSRSLMLQVDIQEGENSTILAENDFRQIALFRGMRDLFTDSDLTANTGNAMKAWFTNNKSFQFQEDEIVQGDQSFAKAKVFWHNLSNGAVFYYQDEETGFKPFQLNEVIEGVTYTARILSYSGPRVDAYSGEIMYINNITNSVERATGQSEDIRIVIQLG